MALRAESSRFYGRRRGKALRAEQKKLVDTFLPSLRPSLKDFSDPASLFLQPVKDVWLEIGFGGGEHLIEQAREHPTVGMIGAEPFLNGVGKFLRLLEGKDLKNVCIYDDDVRPWLEAFPDACLGRVFLLFPDPWPKKRHRARRFVNPSTLDLLARVMKDDAELRIASDDPVYLRHTLRIAPAHPLFHWTPCVPDEFLLRWPDAVETRYEAKAVAAGRYPFYFTFRRCARPAGA